MSSRFFILFVICSILISCGGRTEDPPILPAKKNYGSTVPDQKKGIEDAYEMLKPKHDPYGIYSVRIGDTVVTCTYKGKIEFSDTLQHNKKLITDLKCEFLIDEIYILPREKDAWLIAWQITDQDGQKSYFGKFRRGEMKPEWKTVFPFTNLGPIVVDHDNAYFSTLGIVGKLNVTNGIVDWKHDSLYNPLKWSFKRFYAPMVYDDKIIFIDYPEPGRRERRDTLILDPATGRSLK